MTLVTQETEFRVLHEKYAATCDGQAVPTKKNGTNHKSQIKQTAKMPVRRRKNAAAAAAPDGTDNSGTRSSANDDKHAKAAKKPTRQTAEEFRGMHLAPLPLVMMVLLCSGALWVLSFRDVMATGRSIAGGMDDAMLVSWLAARSIGLEISRYRYPARFHDVQCFLIDNDGSCI